MIEPFWGEFLISPIPLELSLNYCSHLCSYCFANLNEPGRKADIQAIMRFLGDYMNRDTLEATLLKEGYPVVISNRSDPFAGANYRQAIPLLDTLSQLKIPVAIQTKGGKGALDAVKLLPPSVWYISISMLQDSIRKEIEPGAPTIHSRMELIEAVVKAGGRVILGLNPVVPEWLPGQDMEWLIKEAQSRGVEGVWIEELHLNAKQIEAMTPYQKNVLTLDVLERAKKRRKEKVDTDAFFRARNMASALGLQVFSNGQPDHSLIWNIYRETYKKTFPTNQDFVNFAHEANLTEGMIPFQLWANILKAVAPLPEGRFRMSKYIGASAMSIFETTNVPSKLSFDEVLEVIWREYRAKQSPSRLPCCSMAGIKTETGFIQVTDDKKRPYLIFRSDGEFKEYFTPVNLPLFEEGSNTNA